MCLCVEQISNEAAAAGEQLHLLDSFTHYNISKKILIKIVEMEADSSRKTQEENKRSLNQKHVSLSVKSHQAI